MLRESYFLARPGLGIVIGKFIFWNSPKLVAKALFNCGSCHHNWSLWAGSIPVALPASTSRASPSFSYLDLLSLLVSIATKLRQASGIVAHLATCTFNVDAGSIADACWLKASFLEEEEKEKKEKTTQAVKILPTSIKEKRLPRAEAPCIPFTKRNKRNKSMGIRRVTSSSPCLILLTRVERSLLKSTLVLESL
eukprot:1161572-Pelagomonas_calceolata.AAC.4